MMKNRIDLIGRKFGRLTVLKFHSVNENYATFWLCRCSCGTEKPIRRSNLTNGSAKSCGCLNAELVKERATKSSLGGRVKDERIYNIWQSMRQRCYYRKSTEFHRYGARGISVCAEWSEYASFKKWALKNGYKDSLSIDRIDNDGDYRPENCKWSTPTEQANNRRNSLLIEFSGKNQTLAQWSKETKIHYSCLYGRMISGWDVEKMLTTPSRGEEG